MTDLVVDALAAYRVTRLLVKDDITKPMRDWIDRESFDVNRAPYRDPDVQPWKFLSDMLECPWCTGMWVGFGIAFAPKPVRRALAAAAVAGLLSEWVQTLDQVGDAAEES